MTFHRFTKEAREIVAGLGDQAGVEEIIRALLRVDCHATRTLAALEVTPDLMTKLEVVKKVAPILSQLGSLKFLTNRAFNASREAGQRHVGTLGLLIGITETILEAVRLERAAGGMDALLLKTDNLQALDADLRKVLASEGLGGEHPQSDTTGYAAAALTRQVDGESVSKRPAETAEILLAVLDRPDSVGARALIQNGVDLAAFRAKVAAPAADFRDARISQSVRETIARARHFKSTTGASFVNTGHILLAIFQDAWSTGARHLIDEGLYYEALWIAVAQMGDAEN